MTNDKCLDIHQAREYEELSTFECHKMGGNQFYAFQENGQIVSAEELCVSIRNDTLTVILATCSDSDEHQRWTYDNDVSEFELFVKLSKMLKLK